MFQYVASALLGKLGLHAIPTDPIALGGALTVVVVVVAAFGLITFLHRWKWLWREWLTSVDPKRIGVMYIIVSVIMLIRGGADALLMRTQQATSVGASHGILSSNHFQQIFSAHGTMMIFFVAMGMMFGIINLVLPLQIGSRDVAFPFMNNASFWLYAGGVVLVNLSLVIGDFSAAGWLAYPPLSELRYSPTVGVDYWIWSLQIAGIGSLLSGVNFFVTILKMRPPGMTLMKMPMFVWSVLGSMSLVIFAFPILTVTITLLYLDRTLGMHFFTAGGGGNMMMYVNLIWAWGHPEVYILILPAFGVYSEIVATYAKKRLFGYTSMVWAIGVIVLLSFTVWLHHFFTMGADADVNAFFGIATMVIAVPTGVKIFNWLATMYRGSIRMVSPMLWFLGFIFLFTIGGVAGVVLSVPSIDYQLHNSLFLVAHFHMMIVTGVLFGYFAALTYWFPKIFGFRLNERWGRYAFWLWSVGFAVAFIPLYILGFMGATRRLDHYAAATGWQPLFIVAGVGVVLIALAVVCQVMQFIVSIIQRKQNRDWTGDPWDGRTLEWSIPSPAPSYSFAVIPQITDRDQFWEDKQRARRGEKPRKLVYEDIAMPKNTPMGMYIAAGAFLFSFAAVWHIWWLCLLGAVIVIICIALRSQEDESEYIIPASQVKRMDEALHAERVA